MINIQLTEKEYSDFLRFKQFKESQKSYIKKYHQSEKGKAKRKIAQKKYREKIKKKKKQDKLIKNKEDLLKQLKILEEKIDENTVTS